MIGDLQDRVALVTGCGKADGLGAAIARALGGAGCRVMVSDIADAGVRNDIDPLPTGDEPGLSGLVDALRASGAAAAWVLGDVRNQADCAQLVVTTLETWGRLDILVSNAAAPHGRGRAAVDDVPAHAWDLELEVTLRGGFLLARSAVPAMRAGGRGGRVVVVSSVAGLRGIAQRAAYSAAKAGLLGLVRSLAVEVGRDGITVNAICPGLIATSRGRSSAARKAGEWAAAELERRADAIPVGRLGRPDDVAGVARFLASDAAAYLTGQAIAVDGGLSVALAGV